VADQLNTLTPDLSPPPDASRTEPILSRVPGHAMTRTGIVCGAWCLAVALAVAMTAKQGLADDPELRALIERQSKEIEELRRRIEMVRAARPPQTVDARQSSEPLIDDGAVRRIVAAYLAENPGAGMPDGVQSGYSLGQGFVIRSAANPLYQNWVDESRIPFELRCRVRLQLAYYRYKVTDRTNELTGVQATQNANAVRLADFSQFELKRGQLIFEGTAFDPDLRYHFRLNGDTRGLPGLQNNRVVQTSGTADPNTSLISSTGGGVTVDHAVRLFEAWVAYDFHGCDCEKDCAPDSPRWRPTYTIIAGKLKPFFGLEEFLGNANEQFVEFSMADLFFSADDDNRLMAAGVQVKGLEDRFFLQAILTNGSESIFANNQMDDYPGFIAGWWYDFGGSWNQDKKKWDLFGDSISDIDHSCRLVVRVGGCANVVPMNRRSLYGDAEQSRYFTAPGAAGGTRLINLLNGDALTPAGAHAVDAFDAYSFSTFAAAKYRGFSVYNEWWVRDLNNFRTTPNGLGSIIYQDTLGPGGTVANAVFPVASLVDFGMVVQGGYFLIPKKLEVAVRWSMVRGESGDINGDGTFRRVALPGLLAPVQLVNGAFRHVHEADEYTVGINYFFSRHLWKWQTDFGVYEGGNPAGGGQSIAGFVSGADGYLIRSQFQMFF
jgi:hypothetical protein